MNSGYFDNCADEKTVSDRKASVEASLQKITSAMALLDQVGEEIAAAHLQAGLDVLSFRRQEPCLTAFEPLQST